LIFYYFLDLKKYLYKFILSIKERNKSFQFIIFLLLISIQEARENIFLLRFLEFQLGIKKDNIFLINLFLKRKAFNQL